MKKILYILFVLCFVAGCAEDSEATITIEHKDGLTVYYPQRYFVELVCGTRPSIEDNNVIFCAEAAFTGQCLDKFVHSNIAGNHVSNGTHYRGYTCKVNSGAFIYYNNTWHFLYKNYSEQLKTAANNGGMGFGQYMIIYNYEEKERYVRGTLQNYYRALCEIDDKLCIVESDSVLSFDEFVRKLKSLHPKHALYLDMGTGWNYSWYRNSQGEIHILHPKRESSKYQTNWIVFRRKVGN